MYVIIKTMIMNRNILYIFSFIFIATIILSNFNYKINDAQAVNQALENAQADKARLEAELANLEREIAEKQKELSTQKGQSVSISRDIAILTTQIQKSKLDIKAKNLTISKLSGEITQKSRKIESLSTKIENIKDSLSQLLRKNREIDDKSILALILSKDSISEVYGDIENFSSIKRSINSSVNEIRGVRKETEVEKVLLEEKKNKEIDTKVELEDATKKVELSEAEKKRLLSISQNKEAEYQKVLAEKAQKRAAILSALFALRDTAAIPFSKALEYANLASQKTGIRPAFLLGILTQESNLGANQGSCYLTDTVTGAGVGAKSGTIFKNVMKPTRDVAPFISITTALGRDPYKTLVSCPIAGLGYGGAMGPAQFIPSTWQMIKTKVATLLDIKSADPWNPKDAFIASAVFLTGLGAKADSYTSEQTAACRYYGGGTSCTSITLPYGKSVMAKASNIQTNMIDPLQN